MITSFEIPGTLKSEHDAIHNALVDATQAPGKTGTAARELAAILHAHFEREEQIVLPPLGLLEPLAAGSNVSDAVRVDVLKMTDALKSELAKMLAEHQAIRDAVQKLLDAAKAEGDNEAIALAEDLAVHAGNEEQVTYPAAILVGEIIRNRNKS